MQDTGRSLMYLGSYGWTNEKETRMGRALLVRCTAALFSASFRKRWEMKAGILVKEGKEK